MKYVFLLLCLSCGNDDFRKVEKLESFRILGVKASLPEVAPGSSVDLQVLVSDFSGTEASISGNYVTCIDPGISRGAKVSCATVVETNTFTINMNSLGGRTGLSPVVNVTVPTDILNGRDSRDQFNGVGYIVIFSLTVGGTDYTTFKRIIATNRTSPNTNPQGSTLLVNGFPISRAPVDGDELSVTTSLPENYDFINIDGTQEARTEKFQIAWYTSSGEFSSSKTNADETVDYTGDTESSLTLAVIRDERGGLDFVKEAF